MPDAAAGKFLQAGIPGDIAHLIDHHGVDDEGGDVEFLVERVREHAADIACVFAVGAVLEVLSHLCRDGVGSADHRLEQAASAHDGAQVGRRESLLLEKVEHDLPAHRDLIENPGIRFEVFGSMVYLAGRDGLLVLEEAQFC
ncbi:MAG: hypothetical protein BWY66_01239 [bacterium ADurb.Bin374]|nr:MAG: hypothetical protein BWY66_01239 [bacterium ADurb.Bin374]